MTTKNPKNPKNPKTKMFTILSHPVNDESVIFGPPNNVDQTLLGVGFSGSYGPKNSGDPDLINEIEAMPTPENFNSEADQRALMEMFEELFDADIMHFDVYDPHTTKLTFEVSMRAPACIFYFLTGRRLSEWRRLPNDRRRWLKQEFREIENLVINMVSDGDHDDFIAMKILNFVCGEAGVTNNSIVFYDDASLATRIRLNFELDEYDSLENGNADMFPHNPEAIVPV